MFFKKFTPYWYLLGPLALIAAFFIVPFAMALWISMLDYGRDLYQPSFVGLDNYRALMAMPDFWLSFRNTLLFLVCVVPAMITLPIALAVLLNTPVRGVAFFRSLIYLPVIISIVVVGITWKWMFQKDGIVNHLITRLDLPLPEGVKNGWLVNPDVAIYALIAVIIWKAMAYYMMMYLANLQSLSKELYESADIDGAGWLQRHWHITVPHLQPTMVMVAIISTIGCLKIFAEPYVMTRGGPIGSTQTIVYFIYQRAFENLDLGVASAAGIILMLVLMTMTLVQLKLSGFGETAENMPGLGLAGNLPAAKTGQGGR